MRLSLTLSKYIGRQFFWWFSGIFLSLVALIFTFDLIELMRRGASKEAASIDVIFQIALLTYVRVLTSH